ncbi:hypothetical protein M514_05250 [Trichuris suis]|uniref:Uncharacterized protein n=1 Tax=Trichuris suis TaxID=68888 RepID=A0A085ND23_9BILA|nr:hypothetical protein M513_05250 [Trichuris suis]KFD67369.1 hypothetical protein M514_05250 [Trichuris suis]
MTGQRRMSRALIPGHPSLSASLTLDLLPVAGPLYLLRPLDSAMSNTPVRPPPVCYDGSPRPHMT